MFISNKLRANQRIGPHNADIISIIYGTLLGDSSLEKRCGNVRISFQQENNNCEYLFWLWNKLSRSGYCSSIKPILKFRISVKGKKRFYYRFNTFTFSSLNFLYYQFYKNNSIIKRVPDNIGCYLTPLAFACWIMDDGCRVGMGLKLCTNAFFKEDVLLLIDTLINNFNIKSNLNESGIVNQWVIYIPKSEIHKVQKVVKPYIVQSMYYKIQL